MKKLYKTNLQNHKENFIFKQVFLFPVLVLISVFSNPVFAVNENIEQAITLLKQSHIEQCQKNKLKVQLLIAHRKHDQALLKELSAKLDEINEILKPTDDKLTALKKAIKKNPDDETAFNTALLDLSPCE
jgi:ribosomal protein L1